MNELGRSQCLHSISEENLSCVFTLGKRCMWLNLRVPTMPYANPLIWFRHLHRLIPAPVEGLLRRSCHSGSLKLNWWRNGRPRDRIMQDSFYTAKGSHTSRSQEGSERLWKRLKDEEDPVKEWGSSEASHFNADDPSYIAGRNIK